MSRPAALIGAAFALVVLLGIGVIARLLSAGAPADAPVAIGGPFTLTASDGRRVSDAEFRGKWMVVYFGYTHCPDACPTALNSVANALDMMKAKGRDVTPVFITVDPARDTPPVMGRYVGLFDKQIVGLTGTEAQIEQVEHEYRVYAARHPSKDGGYSMDHSSILYVMDRRGRFNSILDGAANPEDIAAKLEKLDS